MLKLKSVSKFYYNKGIIASGFTKINLELKMGEFIAITGESGSGKSTLLNVISGLDSYEEGEMYINDQETSHYTEKDFAIRKISLDKTISEVLLKNKDDLLENSIDIEVNLDEKNIYSDQKWLIFIINQIINNSIKYKDNKKKSIIKITSKKCHDKVILSIYDNGIGIDKEDIPQVFKKSFTGNNGRDSIKSTGMGLYIANKLCEKLGHILEINSKKGEYTELIINFGSNNLYNFNDWLLQICNIK